MNIRHVSNSRFTASTEIRPRDEQNPAKDGKAPGREAAVDLVRRANISAAQNKISSREQVAGLAAMLRTQVVTNPAQALAAQGSLNPRSVSALLD